MSAIDPDLTYEQLENQYLLNKAQLLIDMAGYRVFRCKGKKYFCRYTTVRNPVGRFVLVWETYQMETLD